MAVFEGFIDYLSWLAYFGLETYPGDVVILHWTALTGEALAAIKNRRYQRVETFLDNDGAGDRAFETFQRELEGLYIRPMNQVYHGHEDVNDFLVSKLKSESEADS